MSQKSNGVTSIAKGIEIINDEYSFSKEASIEIAKNNYSLRSKIEYDANGDVVKLTVYKPEGILEYSKNDLSNDKSILTNYGYSAKNEYTYSNDKLLDSKGNSILVEKLEENILGSKNNESITLYYLNK